MTQPSWPVNAGPRQAGPGTVHGRMVPTHERVTGGLLHSGLDVRCPPAASTSRHAITRSFCTLSARSPGSMLLAGGRLIDGPWTARDQGAVLASRVGELQVVAGVGEVETLVDQREVGDDRVRQRER